MGMHLCAWQAVSSAPLSSSPVPRYSAIPSTTPSTTPLLSHSRSEPSFFISSPLFLTPVPHAPLPLSPLPLYHLPLGPCPFPPAPPLLLTPAPLLPCAPLSPFSPLSSRQVGAGILALPAVTSEAGFLPSCATCIVCWLYMLATGMLIAEVNVNTMCELGSGGVSLVSMAQRTLGTAGVRVAGTTYLLIHYAVITAYVSRSADIISAAASLPHSLAASLFTLSFGALCYFGSQRAIGLVNGMLVAGIVFSFAFLLAFSLADIHPQALLAANIAAVPASVPIIALSFVYQNVVPVVATNLEGNLKRIRTAILAGTALPLLMFLLWDAAILGTAPLPPSPQPLVDALTIASDAAASAAAAPSAAVAAVETMKVVDPLARLQQIDPSVGGAVQLFSFFAIATSYIGFILGLSDFLADALKLPSGRGRTPLPYILTLAPPLAFSLSNPDLFFTALDLAGTYGVLVLFGILPAAMAWVDRASLRPVTDQPRLVPGGNVTLTLIIGFALTIITNEFASNFIR
ncbi:unnamed protein product [Closterium sp. Yama58-4]|nr:unnamed protein product [Closterium sp. Yama58-4]